MPSSPMRLRKRKILSPKQKSTNRKFIPRWWAWIFFLVLLIQSIFVLRLVTSENKINPMKLENYVIINQLKKDDVSAKKRVRLVETPEQTTKAAVVRKQQQRQQVLEEDIASAMSYVRSIKSFQRKLNFFHIPKTAGTAIEHVAADQKNLTWGSCAFNHKPKRDVCRHLYPGGLWPSKVGWWHVPSHLFPVGNVDPYRDSELFAVVRDPYDRMVSEYFYVCTLKVKDWRPSQCDREKLFDKDYMNQWLQEKLKSNKDQHDAASFIKDNGHFTQQFSFFVAPNDVRMVDHVLYLGKTLNDDFNRLMKSFSLDIELEAINSIGSEARNTTDHLTTDDLYPETIHLIHELYPHDFGLFNYTMRSTVGSSKGVLETA